MMWNNDETRTLSMSGPAAQSKKIGKKLDAMRAKHLQGTTIPGVPQPAPYFEEDPRDRYMGARRLLTEEMRTNGNNSTLGQFGTELPVGDKEIKYLLDQELKEEKRNFAAWKYQTYKPGSDPVRLKYYEKIDPAFFKEREAQIEKDMEIIRRLAILSLNGVENEEDLMLLYGINMGKIPIPDWKVYLPYEHGRTDVGPLYPGESISQGFWNPKRYSSTYSTTFTPDMYSVHPLVTTRRTVAAEPTYGGAITNPRSTAEGSTNNFLRWLWGA